MKTETIIRSTVAVLPLLVATACGDSFDFAIFGAEAAPPAASRSWMHP